MVQPELLGAVLGEDIGEYPDDPTTERILQAALAEFRSFGLRRATVEDVTRRAKVGRMTLHRRFPSKQALIGAVFLHEIRCVLTDVGGVIARNDTLTDKLVDGLAYGIRAVHQNPLFSRLMDTDPEAMLPYLTIEAGTLMIAASGYVAEQLNADHSRSTSADENRATGEAIIRLCHSILLTPQGHTDLQDPDALRKSLYGPITALLYIP